MEPRPATKEEIERIHSKILFDHEERVGPLIDAMRTRLTAAQKTAFFKPCFVARAMNNFIYRRVFEPDGGIFAGRGVLAYFFTIVNATEKHPCWVVRFNIGEGVKKKDRHGRLQWSKAGHVRPSMVPVLNDLADSMMEGVGGKPHYRNEHTNYYVYRPFTDHERNLANPLFIHTPGVTIGPISKIIVPALSPVEGPEPARVETAENTESTEED